MQPVRRTRSPHRGAVMAEMIIVTPLLVLIVAAIIEFGWVFSIRQDLSNVTRDCARFAMLLNVNAEDVSERLKQQLVRRNLSNVSDNPVAYDTDRGTVTIEASIPYNQIGLWPWAEVLGLDLSVTVRSAMYEKPEVNAL